MLQLRNILNVVDANIEFDFYVPINIQFGYWDAAPIYWRTGDFLHSLIEIGIEDLSGKVCSITLVSPSSEKKGWHEIPSDPQNIIHGLPAFETKEWGDKTYLDVVNNFDVYMGNDTLSIIFPQDKMKIKTKIINGRVVFGLNENKLLCTIEIKDITIDEKALLEESFAAKEKSRSEPFIPN